MTLSDFGRIHELRKLMAIELAEVQNAHEQATNITARLTGMPRGSGASGSMVENAVIRAEVHYARYCKYCEELEEIFARLRKEYIKLNSEQQDVIEMYYSRNMKVGKIAQEKNLSERHVFRLKKEAIELLCTDFI